MSPMVNQLALPIRRAPMPPHLQPRPCHLSLLLHLLLLCPQGTAWQQDTGAMEENCPSAEWSSLCRDCCESHLIQCKCPSQGTRVGYSVPCCQNTLGQCDPCIIHPGCSLFENCKSCHNGTWAAKDDFFIRGKFCTECRQGWAGGDCKTCGGVIRRAQGDVILESYPINAHCEWRVQVKRGQSVELRFSMLSLEPDHNCGYDYVELRNGDSLNSPVIGRFCGKELPPPIRSPGNLLHILFVSDGYNNFDGFYATFQESSVCSPSPCLHQGTCFLDPVQSFRCACLAGYTGQHCENVARSQACETPERPMNGDLLPVYGLGNELLSVQYLCHPPYTLSGTPQRTCLPNATWTGTAPTCVKDLVKASVCPPPPRLYHGYFKLVPGFAGGPDTVEFICNNSYVLSGNFRSTCLSDGKWSTRPPLCVKVCLEPKVSELVRQRVVKPQIPSRESLVHKLYSSSRHKVYDTLTPGMDSSALGKPPRTEDPSLGELPQGFHHLYTSIEYECASPLYRHYGSARRTCLKTGKWSGRHVSCSPVCGKLPAFSPKNLTGTQWPWHAAIYLRSPTRSAVTAQRDGAVTSLSQQRASEEGSAWELVCSGALVTQRSVVVAAHCVAEAGWRRPPDRADVKVVMGMNYRGDRSQMKTLQHLRVSSILVHPNFDPVTLDSDLAVLKLLDKAKISKHVMPVCLPRMQGGEVTTQQAYATSWPLAADPRPMAVVDAKTAQTVMVQLGDVVECERELAQRGTPVTITDNMLCALRHPLSPAKPCPTVTPGITIIPSAVTSTTALSPGQSELQGDTSVVWELLGLQSFGYEQRNCSRRLHTVQTRIVNFRDWIQKNMK